LLFFSFVLILCLCFSFILPTTSMFFLYIFARYMLFYTIDMLYFLPLHYYYVHTHHVLACIASFFALCAFKSWNFNNFIFIYEASFFFSFYFIFWFEFCYLFYFSLFCFCFVVPKGCIWHNVFFFLCFVVQYL
jgi:hypothetical protein